jgi:hypothetical protein
MKELFRFVSIEKFDNLTEPCGKITIDDVVLQTKYYSKALSVKNKKELDDVTKLFFANAFNPDPIGIDPNLSAFYEWIRDKKATIKEPLKTDDADKLCQDITGGDIATFVATNQFKDAKTAIVENLYFLIEEKNREHSKIKIIYKHLLKLIGLLEAIVNKSVCLDRILSNPALQYYKFEVPKQELPKKDDGKKEVDEETKKYKDQLKNEYDEILELKSSQEELLKLHQQNKKLVTVLPPKPTPPQKEKTGFFAKLFGTSSKKTDEPDNFTIPFKNPLLLKSTNLSAKSQKTLNSIGISPAEIDVYGTLNSINDQIINRSNNLNNAMAQPQFMSYRGSLIPTGLGGGMGLEISDKLRGSFISLINSLQDNDVPVGSLPVPFGHGFANVLGEGCLERVEEDYLGCKLANLSSVVNIPANSKKTYDDRYLSKTVSTVELESVDNTFDETSSDSRIQNNLSNEINKVQKFDMSLEAGASVSASYGPVAVEASSKFGTSLSSSETTNSASSYARDVTQRAIKRIEKRSRETIRTERTIENEIKNSEGYDNQTSNHSVGIYQWINEVYKAKLVQYESRLLLEFMGPEPGNMLLYAENTPYTTQDNKLPIPPLPFTIGVDDIKPENYRQYIKNWGATDTTPPPPKTIVISKSISGPEKAGEGDNRVPIHMKLNDESFAIPEGYNIDSITGDFGCTRRYNKDDTRYHHYDKFQISIGDKFFEVNDYSRGITIQANFDENNHWNNLPIAVTGYQARTFVLNLNAYCIANSVAIDKWRIETYSKLKQAYQTLLDDYNDKLALSRQRSFLSGSSGNNPDKNRQTEKEELKRACLSILTNQSFELFDSINDPSGRIPNIKFNQVKPEGDYIRFFETAFEWTQITYILYPYFGANPNKTWLRSLNLKVDDPKHEEFIKSGFARVVIPVRPEFQNAILQYLDNGTLWDGENPDDIDWEHSMYVKPAIELMERQGKLLQNSILKDEWEFELPTNHQIISDGLPLPLPKPFI